MNVEVILAMLTDTGLEYSLSHDRMTVAGITIERSQYLTLEQQIVEVLAIVIKNLAANQNNTKEVTNDKA